MADLTNLTDLADLGDLADLADLASPVLSLAAFDGGLWVGGLGGVAPQKDEPQLPQGPLTSVAALCLSGSVLVAGGSEGIARRLVVARDDVPSAEQWERCEVQGGGAPVAAMVVGPEGVLLAATIGDGVLRSTDDGRTWQPSNFGLDATEVSALAAGGDRELLAGTTQGVFRSRNAGRAWRAGAGTEQIPVAGLAFGPDRSAFAVSEDGRVLRSADGGDTWQAAGALMGTATALTVLPGGDLIAGTADTGAWYSRNAGATWTQARGFEAVRSVYSLLCHAGQAYAGTAGGLAASLDGGEWHRMPTPATYDFSHTLTWRERQLLIGRQSGLVHQRPDGTWELISGPPLPLTCVAVTPDDTLLASGPAGLFVRQDGEDRDGRQAHQVPGWISVLPAPDGMVGRMTFRADGTGLAAPPVHGEHLLRTRDNGRTWERLAAPFGVLPPVTLQALDKTVMVQTVDPRSDTLTVWGSRDDGTTWERVWQGPNRGRPE